MPAKTIQSTPTLVYTSEHATSDAPDQFIFRAALAETGTVALLDIQRGDNSFDDGVYFEAGETISIELIGGQSVYLIAESGTVEGNYYVQEF